MQKKHLIKYSIPSCPKHWKKIAIVGQFLNIVKAISAKPIANIILNGEKLTKSIPPKNWNKAGMTPFTNFIQHCDRNSSQSN